MPIKGIDPAHIPERFAAMFFHNPFAEHFDLEVVSIEPGRAVLRFPFKREFTQYQGAVQGGVVVTYADAAMAIALASVVPEGRDSVTTDLNVQYLRPITDGHVIARGSIEHLGKTLARGRATVEAESGAVIAHCMATFMIVDPRGSAKK
jgi:acyl-CoA thioesterase